MRIVLDGRTIADHFPGLGRYTFNLAQALAGVLPAGDELVLLHDPRQPNTRFDLAALAAHANLRLAAVQARNFSLSEQWSVPAALRRLGAAVYHSPYYLMPYRLPCPSAVTLHDLIPLHYPGDYSAAAILVFRLALRLALRTARRVIAVSQASAADLQQRLKIHPERLAIIPEAPDPMFQPQPPEELARVRTRYELPAEYVLYLGSNKPHKNLPRLVNAFGQIAPVAGQPVLVIAGHWDARHPQARQSAAVAAGNARVRFIGPVPPADLPGLYGGALVFAFPSLYEGFGLPPIEAMACGTPVICSNASSLPEVVGQAALLFDPLDVAAIAATLERALAGSDLRTDLRRRGLEQARRFTWANTARQTLAVYQSIAGSSAP